MTRAHGIERVVYDEWNGNFRSKLRHMGPPTRYYTSQNMQVYEDGTLGTRPWLRLWPTTGQSTSTDDRGPGTEGPTMCQWRPTTGGQEGELWVFEINGDVWTYDFSTSTWATAASITTGTNPNTWTTFGPDDSASLWGNNNDRQWEQSAAGVASHQYYTLPDDNWVFAGGGQVNAADVGSAITWTDATDEMGGFTFYRDRIWAWHQAGNHPNDPTNRLYYTNAGSYTTSAAGNYIDIGAASTNYHIVGAWPVRDSLLICMSNNEWYVFSGPPETGSLRYMGNYPRPAHGACGTVYNNALYFLMPYGNNIAIATPAGVDTQSLSHIVPWVGDKRWTIFHDYRALSSAQEQFIICPTLRTYEGQFWNSLELANGNWGWHGYGVDTWNEGVGSTSNMGDLRDLAMHPNQTKIAFYVYDEDAPGSPATTTQIYTRDIVLNRPSRKTDSWSDSKEVAAGDTSTSLSNGSVRLAPFTPPGEEVRVRQVIVDFYYWMDASNTYYENPTMECALIDGAQTEIERINSLNAEASLTDFETAGLAGDSVLGMPGRWVFRFPIEDQDFRQTVQIQIDKIMSIAISRIVVDYEVRPDNHWAGQTGGT